MLFINLPKQIGKFHIFLRDNEHIAICMRDSAPQWDSHKEWFKMRNTENQQEGKPSKQTSQHQHWKNKIQHRRSKYPRHKHP